MKNKKSYFALTTLIFNLVACNGGSGISDFEINNSKLDPLPPGPQWQKVVPLGVRILYSGIVPSNHTNNVNVIYDTLNQTLYAQHVNDNLYPILLNRQQAPYWEESNLFSSELVNHEVNVTSYLGADMSGHIYGFGVQNNQPVLFAFDDTHQMISINVLSGAYPHNTQFGNLYYDNGSVYALAQKQSGTIYSYSLVKFDATSGAYQNTIDLNYSSENPFVNVYSLPLNNSMPFTREYYLSGALGDGVFYIHNNGIVTAISLANPLTPIQVGATFISTSGMLGMGDDRPTIARMSAIAYSKGYLFTCGYTLDNDKYRSTYAILRNSSIANSSQSWESIGYTQIQYGSFTAANISYYNGCMNISAYGNKVFAVDNTESDTVNSFPYITMVYESSF